MRKLLWLIPGLAFMVISSPAARADATSYTPTFTCSSSGCTVPTAAGVTFPSPTLNINYSGITFSITLNSSDSPGDTYTWASVEHFNGSLFFVNFGITDTTTSQTDYAEGLPGNTAVGNGSLTFASPVPEPSTVILMLAGMVGLLVVSRERIAKGIRPPA